MVTLHSSSVAQALQAAHGMAGSQHYPAGALYVVATPIGNLADITLRALCVLQRVDAVACEDTRHTGALLRAYGVEQTLLAVHEHNEAEAAIAVLARLHAGERIAYVSDAGTPGISDPGNRLCRAVQAAGLPCIPCPGPSSLTAVISVAGCATLAQGPAFEFNGFLPATGTERLRRLRLIQDQAHACVILESPHRMARLADDLARFGERLVSVGRELTKQFEEVATMPCSQLPGWLSQRPERARGEFALVLHPLPQRPTPADHLNPETLRVLELLLKELPVKTAARLCADITGAPKNALYRAALASRG